MTSASRIQLWTRSMGGFNRFIGYLVYKVHAGCHVVGTTSVDPIVPSPVKVLLGQTSAFDMNCTKAVMFPMSVCIHRDLYISLKSTPFQSHAACCTQDWQAQAPSTRTLLSKWCCMVCALAQSTILSNLRQVCKVLIRGSALFLIASHWKTIGLRNNVSESAQPSLSTSSLPGV